MFTIHYLYVTVTLFIVSVSNPSIASVQAYVDVYSDSNYNANDYRSRSNPGPRQTLVGMEHVQVCNAVFDWLHRARDTYVTSFDWLYNAALFGTVDYVVLRSAIKPYQLLKPFGKNRILT